MAKSSAGAPSMRNSHCHPLSPCQPSMLCMIIPDNGPLMTPDSGIAAMNTAVKLARLASRYPIGQIKQHAGKKPRFRGPRRKRAK